MRADYLTYQKATGESIRGLALQLVLAITMLIYAIFAKDHAAMTAAGYIGIGVFAWLCLALVFDQHRRERIEAMEVDAMAASPVAGSSVFEKQEEFRPAAKRLAAMHKYFMPTASLVIAALLLGFGLWRLASGKKIITDPSAYTSVGNTFSSYAGWAMGLGLVIAALSFVFARFTATMGKQTAWANLKAGSAFTVGTAILGTAMAASHFIDIIGTDVFARYLQVAFPVFCIAMGIEIFINFVLGVYRPRKAGEVPPPAFNTRSLGLVAAPDKIAQSISDAINYQLGFDVTSGWFYQLLSRWLVPLIIFGVLIVWGLSCLVVVQPHQRAIVLRFGRPVSDSDIGPGLHFKAPWPIDTIYVPEYFAPVIRDGKAHIELTDHTATGVRTIDLGTSLPGTKDPILWTNEHAGTEVFQFVRASNSNMGGEADLADVAMVSLEIPLEYAVTNVRLFDELAAPDRRDDLLKATAQREITLYMQQVALDDLLTGRRASVAEHLRERIQKAYDKLNPGPDGKPRGAGVEILFIGVSGVHPPKAVAPSFETPVQADERREANIDAAEADAIEKLAKVVGGLTLARDIIKELDKLDAMKTDNMPAPAVAEQELKIQTLLESAGGAAAQKLAEARAARWEQHMGYRGRATRFQGQLAMYKANPELYRADLYFEALKEAMKDTRVYITSENIKDLRITPDLKDVNLGADPFAKKPE